MTSHNSELIHIEQRDEFTIRFYAEPEDLAPEDDFASGDDEADREIVTKIRNGDLAWFSAHVVALKHGHELGHSYLGACCYESARDFVTPGVGYWEDMVAEAIADARKTLAMLAS